MSEIRVRPATPADVARIVDFNLALALETEHKRLDPELVTSGVARGMSRPELCAYFMAEFDGRVVGQTMITYEWSDWRDGLLWWIQSVYVDAEHRRLGVFRALFRHIEHAARNHPDARGLRLYVERENTRAQQTYAALGMKPSGHFLLELDWSGAVREA